ncbi:hypothetical protein [Microbacterium sp. P5_E9]
MTPRAQLKLFIVCVTLIVLGALVAVGVAVKSQWSTFIPDLIIGVVGAAVIGLVLFGLQQSTDRRRAHGADLTAAYNRLLDALTPLRTLDVGTGDASLVSEMRTRMLQLYETVDEAGDQATFGEWINAEGQLCLFQAVRSLEALRGVSDRSDAEAVLAASAPFHQWVAEFTHNLRFWRTGSLDRRTMQTQAEAIESKLRSKGAWQDGAMPWRGDQT